MLKSLLITVGGLLGLIGLVSLAAIPAIVYQDHQDLIMANSVLKQEKNGLSGEREEWKRKADAIPKVVVRTETHKEPQVTSIVVQNQIDPKAIAAALLEMEDARS